MELKLNKYLKELGIDENNWLFNKIDDRYKPDEEGFVDAEHFSLDYSLSLYIYSQLCYFRDNFISYAYYVRQEMTKRGYKTMNSVWDKIIGLKPVYLKD